MKINNKKLINVLDWIAHYLSYSVILILVSEHFNSFQIDGNHMYIYGLVATLIIFILNKTVKPILFYLTIPLTGLTLGLFYPFVNVIILKLTDWILGPHFEIHGLLTVFFIAILISIINLLVDNYIIKPIIRRLKKNE